MRRFIFLMTIVLGLSSCTTPEELSTVHDVDFQRYTGTWYEIARLPNRFEKGLDKVSATYTLLDNSQIEVINSGFAPDGSQKITKGKAYVKNLDKPGELKVQFFWPFAGDYYIIDLDSEYQYALVGTPSRKYLWILAREKQLPESVSQKLMQVASEKGFDTEQMFFIQQ